MDCVEAPHGKCHRMIKDIGNVTVASNWHTIVACVDYYYIASFHLISLSFNHAACCYTYMDFLYVPSYLDYLGGPLGP